MNIHAQRQDGRSLAKTFRVEIRQCALEVACSFHFFEVLAANDTLPSRGQRCFIIRPHRSSQTERTQNCKSHPEELEHIFEIPGYTIPGGVCVGQSACIS
eukprot:4065579-Amphidinium_carterae.1